jgi:acyl-CoA synthetase (AMP-forming)/AMP-acid ligase II
MNLNLPFGVERSLSFNIFLRSISNCILAMKLEVRETFEDLLIPWDSNSEIVQDFLYHIKVFLVTILMLIQFIFSYLGFLKLGVCFSFILASSDCVKLGLTMDCCQNLHTLGLSLGGVKFILLLFQSLFEELLISMSSF